jgi:predicted acyl esterase
MGYATVGVNLRGTGCSGGTFDVFNAAQMADGYDVVETVARQGWVKGNKVGMIGLSYGGITQLYVAPTNPPSLAAIAPQSVIEDPWYQQWPGGIYNSGFTQEWLANRDASSDPGASGWVADRIAGGDAECEANAGLESLRWQNIDFEEFGASLQTRPADAEARRLSNLVPEIDVPVFLTGAWQDEQTGQRFATLLNDFTAAPVKRFTMFNGRHADGFTPLVLDRWFEFLELYVNGVVPDYHPSLQTPEGQALVDGQLTAVFGVPGLPLGEERFVGMSHGDALAAYEAEPDVRVLFEVGAAPEFVDNPPETGTCSDTGAGGLPLCNHPGAPVERWERTFESWPPSAAEAATLYLGPDGTLRDEAPGLRSIDRFAFDPDVGQTSYYLGGDWLKPQIEADWKATDAGEGLAYLSEPLAGDVVVGGDGYVDLWFRSTGTDAPIEIVVSEVYQDPDPGDAEPAEELIVQHGLLRAGWSRLDLARTTPLLKEHLFSAGDYVPLEQGEFVHLQVPVFSIAHAFRAGSRIRLEVNTPGGDTPSWEFINESYGATTHDVAMGGDMASALVLPVLPSTEAAGQVPAEFAGQANHPPCNSLRGQVCRDAAGLTNETVYVEPACDEARFPDVPVSSPFCGEIQWLVEAGVASGYDDGRFRPTAPVSRQATAAFLYRVAGLPEGDPPTCSEAPFPDVGADAELCGEVAWLAGTGITGGFEDGSFRPGAPLSRQAMAAFLHRFHVWRV